MATKSESLTDCELLAQAYMSRLLSVEAFNAWASSIKDFGKFQAVWDVGVPSMLGQLSGNEPSKAEKVLQQGVYGRGVQDPIKGKR